MGLSAWQCRAGLGRLRDEQVDVLRHDELARDPPCLTITDAFEGVLQAIAGLRGGEVGSAAVTGEGEEVEISCLLVAG